MILLVSCTSIPLQGKPANTSITSLSEMATPADGIAGFVEPDPDTWVMLMPAVQEYFYYRKKAVIAADIHGLWEHYPELENGKDISKGINAEEQAISGYQTLKVFDGNIQPEEYERMKVKLAGDQAEVLVHGVELYLWIDKTGNFSNSGGEFKIVLFLQRTRDQWSVYKTDEVTMSEWQQFSP